MERRRFVRLAAATAAVGATGCIGGDGNEDDGGDQAPEAAEFGYSTWIPAADYRIIGYFDLDATRGVTTLSRDGTERSLVGDVSVPYADIDAVISTTGSREFEAYAGGFDVGANDLLPDADTSRHAGFELASGTADGDTVEVAVAEEGDAVVIARGGTDAASVVDAAVGNATRQADEGDIIADLSEYAEGEPLAVQFDYGVGNTVYQFFEERDDGVAFVEVALLPDEQAVEQTIEENYNYSDGRLDDLNMSVRGEGRRLIIENLQSAGSVEGAALGTNGLLP